MYKFSSKLLNYVEPVTYNNTIKTAFYTELNTNFQIGDKVFIISGNYDSDLLISNEKYEKSTDGYTVLDIDKCRIVLDIDYTGVTPYEQDLIDNYVKLHHITSQQEFDYINNITINSYPNLILSKFEYGLSNNLIYTDSSFSSGNGIFGAYSNIPSAGFYQKSTSSGNWIPVPTLIGTSSIYFNTTGPGTTYSLTNNGKLYIVGEDIIIGSQSFKQRNFYSFDVNENIWKINKLTNSAYISKLNFRNGSFKGTWNDGVFGSYKGKANWDNSDSIWKSGIFLNSNWRVGSFDSKTSEEKSKKQFNNDSLYKAEFSKTPSTTFNILTYTFSIPFRSLSYNSPSNLSNNTTIQSYYSSLNDEGNPVQTTDFSDNKGFSYNYIIDSDIKEGSIINGNFINCNIGVTGSTANALDIYYGYTFSYSLTAENGYYESCDINSVAIKNSYIVDSNINNSNIANTKLSSNQIKNTVASGEYTSDNGIRIINADIWSYYLAPNKIRGVLKLYITNTDLLRLNNFETIYIEKINKDVYLSLFNNETKAYIKIENKYILDYIWNKSISNDKILVSTKTSNENLYKMNANYIASVYSNNFEANDINRASIDIDLGEEIAWYNDGVNNIYNNQIFKKTTVEELFTDTILNNSDFKSGLFINSYWKSGSNINDLSNKIKLNGNNLSITNPSGFIFIDVEDTGNDYYTFSTGEYIWINGIDYIDINNNVTEISATLKVKNVIASPLPNAIRLELEEKTNNITSLTMSGVFRINSHSPNYISINTFKIDNTIIEKGLFKSSLIENSSFINNNFDNYNQKLTSVNINQLRFVNMLFKGNNNNIKNGLIYKSHLINSIFNGGILFNNIISGITFSGGTVKNSYWLDGNFNGGIFVDSNDIIVSTASYDNDTIGKYRSWRDGKFNNGQIYNSIWIDGVFNGGKLYNTRWYGGIFNNGVIGLESSPYSITTLGYYKNIGTGSTMTIINGGTIESGIIGGSSSVIVNDVVFKDGDFTSFGGTYSSIWNNGKFNGGMITNYAKWKNGTFNGGKFLSYYGWTLSESSLASDYSWENGIFNGGQFGNKNLGTNSTWYDGVFNGGIFSGRVWNNGVMTNGTFLGSSATHSYKNEIEFVNSFADVINTTGSIVPLNSSLGATISNPGSLYEPNLLFYIDNPNGATALGIITGTATSNGEVQSFEIISGGTNYNINQTYTTTIVLPNPLYLPGSGFELTITNTTLPGPDFRQFYGLWRDGYVVDSLHLGKPDEKIKSNILRNSDIKKVTQNVELKNSLWMNGTFSHASGIFNNSVWLNGTFISGKFNDSSFNPYVDRTLSGFTESGTMSFNLNDTCVWRNGILNNSTFYISEWKDGIFNSGYMLGGIWRKGTWAYGEAENIYWESGTWKNGNWYGSNFDANLTYSVYDNKIKTVLNNINEVTATSSIHIWNAFTGSSVEELWDTNMDKVISNDFRGWTYSGPPPYDWNPSIVYNESYTFISLTVYKNNYYSDVPSTQDSNPIYGVKQGSPFTTAIFEANKSYSIEIDIHINHTDFSNTPLIGFRIEAGYETVNVLYTKGTNKFILNLDNDPDLWTGSFASYLSITRLASGVIPNLVVSILNASIKETETEYDPIYNNELYTIYGSTVSRYETGSILMPPSLLDAAGDGTSVHTQYGNGKFLSGTWENGIWSNGYREDETLLLCDLYPVANYIRISNTTHRIQLSILATQSNNNIQYSIGDYVSVGNIVAIDVNNNRKLLKDKFRVVTYDTTSIVLEYTLVAPILQITKDSENHLIYVSKNIWLSGGFLNGYFNSGIWNYGLVKGGPYITKLENVQWVDGIFDGGHFKGTYSNIGNSAADIIYYNSSLIQNFIFKDNGGTQSFRIKNYLSWIDLVYENTSQVNINRSSKTYEEYTLLDSTTYKVLSNDHNLWGMPTYDILSSNSYIRNTYSTHSNYYSLGYKSKNYYNSIPNNGEFKESASNINSSIGMGALTASGWSFSNITGATYGFAVVKIESNMNTNSSNTLSFTMSASDGFNTGSVNLSGLFINNNLLETLENRYYKMEIVLSRLPIYHPNAIFNFDYSNPNKFNHYSTTQSLIKTEYFYNKETLNTLLTGVNGLDVNIEKFGLYEVDSIPFFQFWTASNIDSRIHAPTKAIAPFIDYSNANYDYIGNIKLVVDTQLVAGSRILFNVNTSNNILDRIFDNGVNISASFTNLP